MTLAKQNGILFPQWPREILLYSRWQKDLQLYFAVYIYSDLNTLPEINYVCELYRTQQIHTLNGMQIVTNFTFADTVKGLNLYSFALDETVQLSNYSIKELSIKKLPKIFLKSVETTAIVMLLISASMCMSWVLSFENIPQEISSFLLGFSDNKMIILLIMNLILLIVGIFMDITPAVLIFTPIFLPVVTTLGIDPVHFGIILVLNLCIGLCTPPVGSLLFVGVGVGLAVGAALGSVIAIIVCT